jgi:hypothetical protein
MDAWSIFLPCIYIVCPVCDIAALFFMCGPEKKKFRAMAELSEALEIISTPICTRFAGSLRGGAIARVCEIASHFQCVRQVYLRFLPVIKALARQIQNLML